ncbi:MAG TPA: toll/interleukin-1 receptor domain-containing protein [Pyrinomonadaceae bacterium]|nr:toll/interleukin-1 receptor domain-containing protein [Pyrinomonadaceae bacterium]
MTPKSTSIRIFLCHSSADKPAVRQLHERLLLDGFHPWLDEEALLPGDDWRLKILEEVNAADIVIVCLSASAINKRGYVQKEIKYALDVADELPEGTPYLIPVKLEECEIPQRLSRWQYVNLFEVKGYDRLISALVRRAASLEPQTSVPLETPPSKEFLPSNDANVSQAGQKKSVWSRLRSRSSIVVLIAVVLALIGTGGFFAFKSRSRVPADNQPSSAILAEAESYLNRGKECNKAKDYDCAITNYTKAIQLNPRYVEAYYQRGVSYDDKRDYVAAIKDYDEAIKLEPQFAEAYFNRGAANDSLQDNDAAIRDYTKAIELKPRFKPAYTNRGSAFAEKEDFDSAIKDYNTAISLDPQYAEAYYNRASTYDDKGDYAMAISDYSKAIELKPAYAEAYVNRGVSLDNIGKYRLAIKDYTKALELSPNDALAYENRAIDYERTGQIARAKADRQKIRELSGSK